MRPLLMTTPSHNFFLEPKQPMVNVTTSDDNSIVALHPDTMDTLQIFHVDTSMIKGCAIYSIIERFKAFDILTWTKRKPEGGGVDDGELSTKEGGVDYYASHLTSHVGIGSLISSGPLFYFSRCNARTHFASKQ